MRQGRSFSFMFLKCFNYLFYFSESGLPQCPIGWCAQFFASLEPYKQKEILEFSWIVLFCVFACSPLASGRGQVCISLKRATMKIELVSFPLLIFIFTIFPPRRQPTTLVSARGPTAGTPSGNLSCLTRLRPFFILAFLCPFRVTLWRPAVGPQGV